MSLLDAMPRRPLRIWPPCNAIGAALCLLVFIPLPWFAERPVWDTPRDDMTVPGNSPAASPGGQAAVLDATLRRASPRPDKRAAIQQAARIAEQAEI